MRKIVLIALFALLLTLSLSGAVLAEEATPAFCGTLSQADCAILQNAQAKMKMLDSASFDLQINATVTNVPGESEPVAFSLSGNGSASGLQATGTDVTLAQTDPGQYLVNILDNADLDLNFTLNLPLAVTAEDPTIPSSITLQMRLVDGIGYLNTDTLRSLMGASGASGASPTGWYGLDLANFFKAAMQQMPELFSAMNSGMNTAQYVQDFESPDFLNRIAKIERTDDGSGSVASFQVTINMGAMMSSPDFQAMIRQEMQSQNPSMTEQELEQGVAMSSQMLKGMTVVITEDVGTDDGYIHDVKGTFNFDSTGMMAVLDSTQTGVGRSTSTTTPNPTVEVDFTLTYSNFDSAPTISAPTNPTIIPYQSLLGMMSGETGGGLPSTSQ